MEAVPRRMSFLAASDAEAAGGVVLRSGRAAAPEQTTLAFGGEATKESKADWFVRPPVCS